jgi:hypothetical protein
LGSSAWRPQQTLARGETDEKQGPEKLNGGFQDSFEFKIGFSRRHGGTEIEKVELRIVEVGSSLRDSVPL